MLTINKIINPLRIILVLMCRSLFIVFSLSSIQLSASSETVNPPTASPRSDQYLVQRNSYFGDLHIHTSNSSDAFIFNVIATADDAYRYAKGNSIQHILGYPMKLSSGPLDFAAVTDHAELLGIFNAMSNPKHRMSKLALAKDLQSTDRKKVVAAFVTSMRGAAKYGNQSVVRDLEVIRSAWQQTIEAAERHNQPGKFTTFIGYEYSSAPKNQNLHRNVIFQSNRVPNTPFSSIDSENPENLWHWLDQQRALGNNALAIPHNSNVSNGLMFQKIDWAGNPIDESYAKLRLRNEPLVEITQVKGTSETHPVLSPNDEWAEFELYDNLIASKQVAKKSGGFVREAYLNGLVMQKNLGSNPYKFGLIGSSDSHNAAPSVEENQYFGKVGFLDGTAKLRGSIPSYTKKTFGSADAADTFTQWSASGLTGIWAEQNTRESLFRAMKRKETFATSGPRIQVRFFASYQYSNAILNDPQLASLAYKNGVTMGSNINMIHNRSPTFILWAIKDPHSYNLQRLQIIKGWIENGNCKEKVFDVACGNGKQPDKITNRCLDETPSLNFKDCSVSALQGATELKSLWKDPTFDSTQLAFYYVRVLEEQSCRWSTWDAVKIDAKPRRTGAMSLQERAWSSPIWAIPK